MSLALILMLLVPASAVQAERLSFYGTPSLIDMPTAETLNDGEIGLTVDLAGAMLRNTFVFQITPRAFGTFRYAIIEEFDGERDRFDRSFDFHYQLVTDTP